MISPNLPITSSSIPELSLKTTNPLHINHDTNQFNPNNIEQNFGDVMKNALLSVNDLQNNATQLSQLMVTSPDLVNVHDVTVAISKAEVSLGFFKSVTDRVIQAYRELINLR